MSVKRKEKSNEISQFDIAIVGGGINGLVSALAFAGAGLSVAIIDQAPLDHLSASDFDGRGLALALTSQRLIQSVGGWDDLAPFAAPILDIRVTDQSSKLFLHYDHTLVGTDPMGYIIEAHHIRRVLTNCLQKHANIHCYQPAQLESFETLPGQVTLTLNTGQTLSASLVLGCDGRQSTIRKQLGFQARNFPYHQKAIVCSVTHAIDHAYTAHERFLAPGPFALLPLPGGYHSSVVWVEQTDIADHCLAMDKDRFEEEMTVRFGETHGRLNLVSPKWGYPLSLQIIDHMVAPRIALVGDSAHGVHPISGQGLNLGLRDIAVLFDQVMNHAHCGLDIGDLNMLRSYEHARKTDIYSMIAATDGLNRLFSNRQPLLRLGRDVGLATVEQLPLLKSYFMKHAMGLGSHIPVLMQNQAA